MAAWNANACVGRHIILGPGVLSMITSSLCSVGFNNDCLNEASGMLRLKLKASGDSRNRCLGRPV
jgi:hypothetical protein